MSTSKPNQPKQTWQATKHPGIYKVHRRGLTRAPVTASERLFVEDALDELLVEWLDH